MYIWLEIPAMHNNITLMKSKINHFVSDLKIGMFFPSPEQV